MAATTAKKTTSRRKVSLGKGSDKIRTLSGYRKANTIYENGKEVWSAPERKSAPVKKATTPKRSASKVTQKTTSKTAPKATPKTSIRFMGQSTGGSVKTARTPAQQKAAQQRRAAALRSLNKGQDSVKTSQARAKKIYSAYKEDGDWEDTSGWNNTDDWE